MIEVQIADKNGHTTLMMSAADTVDLIEQHSGAWVFADNQMVQANQMGEADFADVSNVRIVPGLVGG
jgi:hypothetical protein